VLILSHADVRAALSPEACERAMRDVLASRARGATHQPLRSVMAPPSAGGLMGLMPAWGPARDGAAAEFALKVVCVMRGNPARGLDAHQGVVVLFDGETGLPEAVLDASAVTEIRTAAVTAVATDLLARPGARVLAILGAGVQARAHVRALRTTREYTEIRAYAPTAAHVGALDSVTPCATAEEAVRGADVVVTATNSRTPVLRHEWLTPGAHVNAIGASMPSAHEIEPETFAEAAVFADSRESVRTEAGEYRLAVERGLIKGEDHIRAELGEVLAGLHGGRAGERELTLFRSLGIAVEDLAAARSAVDAARELGIGIEVAP
jgi:ornithine cyclodeaminase